MRQNTNNTNLPRTSIKPVPVHLSPANSQHRTTVAPPQVIAALDDVIPVFTGERGPAQTPDVQLAEDPHTHLCWQGLYKVLLKWIMITWGHGWVSFRPEDGAFAPFADIMHPRVLKQFQFPKPSYLHDRTFDLQIKHCNLSNKKMILSVFQNLFVAGHSSTKNVNPADGNVSLPMARRDFKNNHETVT